MGTSIIETRYSKNTKDPNYLKTGSVDGKYASKVNKKISTAQRNDKEYQRLSRKVTQKLKTKPSAASNLRDRASEHNMDITEYMSMIKHIPD